MGSLKDRLSKLTMLDRLPKAVQASDADVFRAVELNRWFSRGIGFIDAHVMVSAMTTPDTRLWTSDNRLATIADERGILFAR